MATIGNYKEEYIKYNSDAESKPETWPVSGAGIEDGTFLYDVKTGDLYARVNGSWVAQ